MNQPEGDAQLPSLILQKVGSFEQTLSQILSSISVGAGIARNGVVNQRQEETIEMGAMH
jgi:hypothetical protein